MNEPTILAVNFDTLREALQAAGYRVETISNATPEIVSLRSSTGGLAFDVYPGNRLNGDAGFADIVFAAALQMQQGVPADLANRWNATRRFGRLSVAHAGQADFIILNMDVLVAGGVPQNALRSHIEIWDALAQDLVGYLREELRRLGGGDGADANAGAADAYRPAAS